MSKATKARKAAAATTAATTAAITEAVTETATMEAVPEVMELEDIEVPAGVTLEVSKPKAKKDAPPAPAKPEIISAQYGTEGNMVEVDVKATKLRPGRKASNRLVPTDPAVKMKKVLKVKAIVAGVEQDYTFAEGDIVKF